MVGGHYNTSSTAAVLAGPITHLYPARMFISEDFPAPEGPIMAVSSPDGNIPDIFLSICEFATGT